MPSNSNGRWEPGSVCFWILHDVFLVVARIVVLQQQNRGFFTKRYQIALPQKMRNTLASRFDVTYFRRKACVELFADLDLNLNDLQGRSPFLSRQVMTSASLVTQHQRIIY